MFAYVGRFVLYRTKLTALLIAGLLTFGASGSMFVTIDDGMRSAFKENSANYREYVENWSRFTPTENDIAVIFSATTFSDPAALERVRSFALEANLATNVAEVYSIFSLRDPPNRELTATPILANVAAGLENLDATLADIRTHPLGGERLLSSDFAHTLVLVTLEREHSAIEPARKTLAELQRTAEMVTQDSSVQFGISGLVPIRQIVIDGILGDLVVLNGIGMIIGTMLCLIVLRTVSVALLTMVAPAMALMVVLGSMGWAGLAFNTLTNAIPVLVLVLALADSLHMTANYRRQRAAGKEAEDAIYETLQRVGPACALTSFTTTLAFAALLISPSELVRSFAWSGVLATLAALVMVLVVHPLTFVLAAKIPVIESRISAHADKAWNVHDGLWMQSFGTRHCWSVSLGALALLVAALAAFSAAEPKYSFLENVAADNRALINLKKIEAELTPTATIDLIVSVADQDPFSSSSMARLKEVHDAAKSALPDVSAISLIDFIDWARADGGGIDRAENMFGELSDIQQARFVAGDKSASILRVFVPDNGATETVAMLDKIEAALQNSGAWGYLTSPPTGLLAMSGRASIRMIQHVNVSFAVAVLASGILIALWLRNIAYGLVALLPNILPIALIGAFLWASGNGLQFSSALALTIAFGIAVDDTTHVMNQMRWTAPAGAPFDGAAIDAVYRHLAPVLVSTTLILAFGVLGTLWSAVPTVAYFGILTFCVLVLALVSVLLVLPAVMGVLAKLMGDRHDRS
jgi:predicted RND superfamily exporter protein